MTPFNDIGSRYPETEVVPLKWECQGHRSSSRYVALKTTVESDPCTLLHKRPLYNKILANTHANWIHF